jgi:hypothetical protein
MAAFSQRQQAISLSDSQIGKVLGTYGFINKENMAVMFLGM